MNTELEWTESARNRWDQFLGNKVSASSLDREAAEDLREDLTLHLEEELVTEQSNLITQERIERAISELGGEPAEETLPPKNATQWQRLKTGTISTFTIFFGVIMPLIVLTIEFLTGMCGSTFFDPFETWWHVFLVVFVAVTNWWLLTKRSHKSALKPRALLSGISMGVSLFYGILFLPLVPLSILALLYIGLGLLSLTPVFNAFATWSISRRHRKEGKALWNRCWKTSFLATIITLFAFQVPSVWTRLALTQAVSKEQKTAERGLAQLRLLHHEGTLLRACYEGNRGTSMSTDIAGWLVDGWQMMIPFLWDTNFRSFNSEEVRDIYYKITGTTFNSQAPPEFIRKGSSLGRNQNDAWNDVQWDDHLGGEQVAVRLANLDLINSRLDGHLDAPSGLSYQEWTLVFKNDNSNAQEARMQLLLPEDGVVSRLTLWVNGEPREAAFSSKSKVREAYQSIAVRQQRDPVLVTATGPGRVLVQCFPVPANGGEMKIRLGITAPLKNGQVATPLLLERNFGIEKGLKTSVWMQGPKAFNYRQRQRSHRDGLGQSLQCTLSAKDIQQEGSYFATKTEPTAKVWCEDQFAEPSENYLTRILSTEKPTPIKSCIVVVDGSLSMRPFAKDLDKILSSYDERLKVVIATDDVSHDKLSKYKFSGGRDNGAALNWAFKEALQTSAEAIIWLHGPQPLKSEYEESIAQLMERSSTEIPLYSIACRPGENQILEGLFKNRSVQMGPRLSQGITDLQPWLKRLMSGEERLEATWERSPSAPETGKKVWDQLARYWAVRQVRTGSRAQSADNKAIAFAAKYQLVTAYSGAVVLETAEQFKQHGLTPVDTSTTPNIPSTPEPSTWLLLLLTGSFSLWRRRR